MEGQVNDILNTIADAVAGFQKGVPGTQQIIYEELLPIVKKLDVKNGKLLNNINNLKLIMGIKNKLQKIIVNNEYKKNVNDFIDAFHAVGDLNNQYFSSFNDKFKPTNTLPVIRQMAIEQTINDLVGQGLSSSVVDPIHSILKQNITTGGSYAQFTEELRNHILTNDTGDGSLEKYSKQITVDAIHQYNAQYQDTIAQDLQFKWGQYVGSLLTTSREFCVLLTEKRWVHISELPVIIAGNIDGKKCQVSKKTKLPLGMIEGTNAGNFKIRRGGYNCGHQFFWVPDSSVPKALLDKFAA